MIATTGADAAVRNSAKSPIISMPFSCAVCKTGSLRDIPGLTTIRSISNKISSVNSPTEMLVRGYKPLTLDRLAGALLLSAKLKSAPISDR